MSFSGFSRLGIMMAFAILSASISLRATPPSDPICAPASSLGLVQAVRNEAARQARIKQRASLRAWQAGALPQLAIEWPRQGGAPQLILNGTPGETYHLETTGDLRQQPWDEWVSFVMDGPALHWSDASAFDASARYFRLRAGGPDLLADSASNFRLLDQAGVAHDLFYHTHRQAIAVLAAGTALDGLQPLVPVLNDLVSTYTNKAELWVLLSDPAPVRSNVLAQVKAMGLLAPVLFDTHGVAARSVGLTREKQVAVVQPPTFVVPYRGEIGGGNATATESYLGQALAALTRTEPVKLMRTPARGAPLAHVAGEVPGYAEVVAPIFRQYCATCHRPNGVAPFALTNHSVAEAWAPVIKHAVLSGRMPPWHADPEYGRFANNLSLPGEAKSALVRWLDAGAPRGSGGDPLADLPPPPAFDEWPPELGEPDAVVSIPVQPIKAEGSEPYRYIYAQSPNPTNVWLKAAIVRPSNYRAVHHYLVWKDRIGNSGTADNSTYEAHIAEFVPGYRPFQLPPDTGIALTRSNWLTFNLHYTPYGEATNDVPTLALWYYKTKPRRIFNSMGPANNSFVIPAGARDHPVATELVLNTGITIHRLNPHMHVRGKRVKYEVLYPGGRREVLLSVPDYDFAWQVGYELAEPKVLPAGAKLLISGAFDNSPQNLSNPDPGARVRWGDQSWMEMFVGFIDFSQ